MMSINNVPPMIPAMGRGVCRWWRSLAEVCTLKQNLFCFMCHGATLKKRRFRFSLHIRGLNVHMVCGASRASFRPFTRSLWAPDAPADSKCDHLNDAGLQLLHRGLLLGLHGVAHHLPLHHAVLVQRSLVLVQHAFLMALAEILDTHTQSSYYIPQKGVFI